MSNNNKVEDANDICFHVQASQGTGIPCVVLRATGKNYTPEDLDFITAEVEKQTGVSFSWRIVPETEHALPEEVIIEFTNNNKETK